MAIIYNMLPKSGIYNPKTCRRCKQSFVPLGASSHYCSLWCRFFSKVQMHKPDKCWEWLGSKAPDGYSKFLVKHKSTNAHRTAYELFYGPIPEHGSHHGICVLHKCDNRGCVNPHHLFLGTQGDNIRDMLSKNRRKKTYLGEDNPAARLTEKQVKEIRKYLQCNVSMAHLSRVYGVGKTTISHIKYKETWQHI